MTVGSSHLPEVSEQWRHDRMNNKIVLRNLAKVCLHRLFCLHLWVTHLQSSKSPHGIETRSGNHEL